MLFARHRLALRITLIVSGGLALPANATETYISSPVFTTQQLRDIDRLNVLQSGSVVVSGTAVEMRDDPLIPFVHINNDGQIISTGASAIETITQREWGAFGHYYINNNSGALIQGALSGIHIQNHEHIGDAVIDNSGTIRALNGQAIDLSSVKQTFGRSNVINRAGGLILASGGDAIRAANKTDINNSGEIISRESSEGSATFDGINIGSALAVNVYNTGLIFGARHGVSADQFMVLNNMGIVSGRNGSGVYSEGEAYLGNTGLIIGGDNDLKPDDHSDGIRIKRLAGISNYGGIQGSHEGISIGGGSVYNSGVRTSDGRVGLIRGASNGIVADDGNGGSAVAPTYLINYGIIRGLNDSGVKLIGEFDDIVQNDGLISGGNGIALDMGGGDDQLRLKSGSHFEGVVDGGSGRNTMTMGWTGYNYDPSFPNVGNTSVGESRNFAELSVEDGEWTLTGSGDFSEGVSVSSYLTNLGGVAGDVTVWQGGWYGGSGTVPNLKIYGNLITNTSIGAPRVNGNLTMMRDSTLLFVVNADGTAATTRVAGNASLSGASLVVSATPGTYPWHSQYTVLEAGSITGTFDHVSGDNYAFLDPRVSYQSNRVEVSYIRNDVDLSDYALTPNSASAVESIQSIGGSPDYWGGWQGQNPLYDALLNTSETTASAAIESLAGSSNANLSSATLNASAQIGTSMLSAMRQMGSGAGLLAELDSSQTPALAATGVPSAARNLNDPNARGRVWLQGLGSYGKLDGEHGSAGLEQRTSGSLLGVDWSLSPIWHVGVLGGYSKTNLDSHNVDGTLHSWHVGAYAMRQDGPLALRLGAAYSRHDGDSKRTVEFEGFSDKPKGAYDADSQQAFAEVGYLLGSGRLNVEPFANLGYQRYHRDGFTEKGGLAALNVDDQTEANFSSTFGVRLAHLNRLENGISLTPRASLGWRHTFGDVDSETRQAFVLGGSAFNVEGSALDRDSLMVEAGVDVGLSARHTLSVGYNGELGSNSRNHALIGQWQMSF